MTPSTRKNSTERVGGAASRACWVCWRRCRWRLRGPASASTETVVSYFVDHRLGFLRQAWVACCGVILLIPFAWALYELLRRKNRALAGGALLGAVLTFVGAFGIFWIPWVVIAFRPGRSPEVVGALRFGTAGQFIGVGPCLALLFGAVVVGTRDGAMLPKWLAWLLMVQIPLNILLAGSIASDGLLAPSGPIGFASIGLFTVFGLGASISMIHRSRAASA